MSKSFTRRSTIIAGIAGSAAILSAPAALAEKGKSTTPTPTVANGETRIFDKPLAQQKQVSAELPGKDIPVEIPQDTNDVVLQGIEGKNVKTYATMVGCSWEGETPDSIEARALSTDGKWSNWFRLDPIGDDETRATEAAWIGESIEVEIRASLYGEDVSDEMIAHLIETSEEPYDENPGGNSSGVYNLSAAAVTTTTYQPGYKAPTVISRKGWAANESYGRGVGTRSQTKGVFLHHTAGSNNYTRAQSAQHVRGMYNYHTRTLGWADLGYNVVVDKYGQIFEGRKGGLARNVVGAHSRGFNSESFGVSVMGDYSSRSLPSAAIEAVSRIIAWKLGGTFNMSATAKTSFYNTTTNVRFPVNTTARLNIISAHRDVNFTDCPGSAYYKQLPAIRNRVQALLNSSWKNHYNVYKSAGGAGKLGTVTEIAQSTGKYQVTRLTKGLIISTNGSNAKGYVSSFSSNWTAAWGLPLISTNSDVQAFENGSAIRANGKVTFSKGGKYFVDVPDGLQFATEINTLASKNILRGWDDETYRPLENVKRDAMIAFIYRAMGSPTYTKPKTSPFTDVKTNNIFFKEIAWAYENGIAEGWKMSNGSRQFRPLENVKRDAMAAFLMRASGDKAPAAQASFSDVRTNQAHAAAMTWMKNTGISTGWTHNNTYQPLSDTKRDAMAAFIYRWMKYTKRL